MTLYIHVSAVDHCCDIVLVYKQYFIISLYYDTCGNVIPLTLSICGKEKTLCLLLYTGGCYFYQLVHQLEYLLNVICFLLLPLSQAFATSSDLFHLFLQRDVWSSHVFPEGTWSGYVYHGVILQTGQGRVYERDGGLGPRYVCGPEYPMCL